MYQSFFFEIKKFSNFVILLMFGFFYLCAGPTHFLCLQKSKCKAYNKTKSDLETNADKAIPSQLDVRRQFLAISWQAANFEVFWGAV